MLGNSKTQLISYEKYIKIQRAIWKKLCDDYHKEPAPVKKRGGKK